MPSASIASKIVSRTQGEVAAFEGHRSRLSGSKLSQIDDLRFWFSNALVIDSCTCFIAWTFDFVGTEGKVCLVKASSGKLLCLNLQQVQKGVLSTMHIHIVMGAIG